MGGTAGTRKAVAVPVAGDVYFGAGRPHISKVT
jgi:hypothetical protein